ncbi:MAG TPA: hypothetical protein VE954_00630 [Oligoflexus sp.]|uniref:hypothetical protein n=1 Tax=Oligoflexus sp. TaxID=1971216 RepID=UPI002D62AAEC|nr:hypothetical protein [Oligoflexus sp.]HYX31584.1 hypothetical protein [Oligoflexus sp.]
MYSKIIPAILTVAGLAACGQSSSKSDDTTATTGGTTTGTTRTATGAVQATSVDELGMSGALNIVLPDAISDGSSGLRLAGQKSMEACLMRESAKQLVTQIDMISSTLCHIEAEGKNIPWNTPVVLDVSEMAAAAARLADGNSDGLDDDTGLPVGGPPSGAPTSGAPDQGPPDTSSTGGPGDVSSFTIPKIGIYADDTDGNKIAVYICEGETTDAMKLVQAFKITGSKSITKAGKTLKVSKGTINIASGNDTMGTFKGAIGFDSNYTAADVTALNLEVKFGFTGFSFAQKFELSSNDAGLSKVSISETGTMDFGVGDPFTFKNAGIGMFDSENGNVFYSYDGNGQTFATQACVDSDSYLADCSAAKFATGGDLHLKTTDVPGVLPASFSPTAPSGFDCATADWSKTITPSTDSTTVAKHQACDAGLMEKASSGGGMGDCFSDQSYAQSSQAVDIEFTEEKPGDFEPELGLRK